MNNSFDNLEVLAPAGNPECFLSALHNGADAIYLGLSSFNARMKAQNFTTENIREYVTLAHTYGTKVYITVNTLLRDEDFPKLVSLIKSLTEAKVDAFIVQDYGVAHVLKTCFEGIVLHASTQMGIHNLEGAKFAKKLGFSRIVLSRETKLEDIKLIKKHTNLEIEYFVQGALCVAFSGNCYLSSLEKNLSGNEGKCLQLCRLPFTNNLTSETKYYLSARDLCLIDNLKELIDAGVCSFKIEGRMRHAGYVATATNVYKSAINLIKTNTISDAFLSSSKTALTHAFSRGDYNHNAYLNKGVPDSIIYPDYQNHIGEKVGSVLSVTPFKTDLFKVKIRSTHPLSAGDGLKIINPKTKEQICSLGVGNPEQVAPNEYVFITKNKFASGLDVHLIQDAAQEEKLLKNRKKIKINIKIIAKNAQKLKITAQNQFSSIDFETDFILQKAQNQPLDKTAFESQFSKLNDTPFELENLELETDGVFIPKSLLNEARRNLVSKLQESIIFENEKHLNASYVDGSFEALCKTPTNCIGKNLVIVKDSSFDFDPNNIYIYAPDDYQNADCVSVLQKTKPENFALSLPTIQNSYDFEMVKKVLGTLPKNIYLFANNISGLNLADAGYSIIASPLLNIKNKFAVLCLNSLNINIICSSVESDQEFADTHNLVWFESGNFPLMTFAHCPFKTIYGGTCKTCKYTDTLAYKADYQEIYKINRTKVSNCYFELQKPLSRQKAKFNLRNFKHQT